MLINSKRKGLFKKVKTTIQYIPSSWPIGNRRETTSGASYKLSQEFSQERFERMPKNGPPYDTAILLERILGKLMIWRKITVYFTHESQCPALLLFYSLWKSHGLDSWHSREQPPGCCSHYKTQGQLKSQRLLPLEPGMWKGWVHFSNPLLDDAYWVYSCNRQVTSITFWVLSMFPFLD